MFKEIGKYSNNGNKIYLFCINNYKNFIVFVRSNLGRVVLCFIRIYVNSWKVSLKKSKEPCTSVKIDFDFDSKLFKSELLSNLAVMKIFPQDPIDIFIDCILHVLINLDKCSTD